MGQDITSLSYGRHTDVGIERQGTKISIYERVRKRSWHPPLPHKAPYGAVGVGAVVGA
jgi:hypothetical protein